MSLHNVGTPWITLVGSLFVLLAAVHRFNTPPTNRAMTTAGRYYAATLLYATLLVALYVLVLGAPVLAVVVTSGDVPKEWAELLPPPLLVALFLTVLLPTLPLLEPLDAWLRKSLQNMAAIPHEARRLAAEMRRSPYAIPVSLRQKVKEELTRQGFDVMDVDLTDDGTLHCSWTKITALMLQLGSWESDRRFASFVSMFREDYGRIQHRYQQLAPKARHWFKTAPDLRLEESATTAELARQYQAELSERCAELIQDVCTFLSRGLLKCDFTYASRSDRLRALGFDLSLSRRRLTLNRVMLLFGAISIVFIFGFGLVAELREGPPSGKFSMGVVLARTVMIAIIYTVAVCAAILPKERWPRMRRGPDEERPTAFYFLAGFLAATASLGISFLFHLAMRRSWQDALAAFALRYPWALMSFMTAFLTACLADNRPPASEARARQRRLEGAAQAAGTLATAVVVRLWLADIAAALPSQPVHVPSWPTITLLSTAIGFIIGFNVPTWYREAPRRAEAPADLPVADAAPA